MGATFGAVEGRFACSGYYFSRSVNEIRRCGCHFRCSGGSVYLQWVLIFAL
ncbi:hypothetical protein CHISP_1218 [Chitinispirillum alkaliphilum]|nr:hypothetical protein CHISP_1218 [Chitinispirillum alkaliphilum]